MLCRGVKFLFSPGESVLCFEPDTSKARVLYHAKVLETSIGKDVSGKRIPEYLIHFQGWNNSWDRVVSEYLVLKDSEENQHLMKKISTIARKVRGNKNRIKKINSILKRTLPADNKIIGSDVEDNSSTCSEISDHIDTMTNNSATLNNDEVEPVSHEMHSSSSTEDGPTFTFDIPSSLKKVLDEDFNKIQKHKQLLQLPVQNNVVTILEAYARDYAINIISSTGDRGRTLRENNRETFRNITLCNEVMSGLRILFDFFLPTNLLYNAEKSQYDRIILDYKPATIKHEIIPKTDVDPSQPDPTPSTSPRESRSRAAAAKNCLPTVAVETKTTKNRGVKRELDPDSDSEKAPPAKRITRQSEKNRSPDSIPVAPSRGRKLNKPKRASRRLKQNSTSISESSTTTVITTADKRIITTESIDSNDNKKTSINSGPSLKHGISDVLDWKLIPDEVYHYKPTPPSVIYGTIHLIRLFVNLPEVIGAMNIPHNKRKILLVHFEKLLAYITQHKDELLQKSAYIDQ